MSSTKKVFTFSAGIIAIDCMLAGMAIAGLTGQEVGSMSELLSVSLTLVVVLAGLNVALIKLHIKDWRNKQKADEGDNLLAEALEKDTDIKALLTKIATTVTRHDDAIAQLLEDRHLHKAENEAGELKPL